MYKKILIPLENSATDDVILAHIVPFAKLHGARLLLVHVADGFVARNQETLNLSDSDEMKKDRTYLEQRGAEMKAKGLDVEWQLGKGEPAPEILNIAEREGCDLIAMATHGHRFLGDLLWGSVAENVRHRTDIPILMVRAPKKAG